MVWAKYSLDPLGHYKDNLVVRECFLPRDPSM